MTVANYVWRASVYAFICMSGAVAVTAQENQKPKLFDGFYGGAEIGFHRVYGGAFLGNLDVLQDASRATGSLLFGGRHQTKNNWVFGWEGHIGLTDGDLVLLAPAFDLTINYNNNSHWAAGLSVGRAIGAKKDWLLFGYGVLTFRNFDIDITLSGEAFTQEERMGVIRYGLGVEKQWKNGWGFRVSAGRNYTDFRDLVTTMDVNGKFEVSAGLIHQF